MKKALIAALAALSATAWVATPAYAQRNDDRGRHERGDRGDNDRGQRRDGDGQRGRGDGQRARGDGQQARPAQAENGRRAPQGEQLLGGSDGRDRGREQAQRGDDNRRGDWNVEQRRREQAQRGDDNRRGDWNVEQRRREQAQRGDDNRRGDWNVEQRRREQAQGDWNRDGRRDGDWNRDGRRDGDWNRDGRRDGDRDGRDWRNDGRRDWADNDWGGRRDDDRYRRWRHTHRDFDRPRYTDWRHVRHGHYFDHGYASIVHLYFGWNYYWWGYDGWRRPHRSWAVGYYLPEWIYWEPVPYDLYYRLPPAPYGCRYVMVDRDILLIAITSGLILDALMYY